MLCTYDINQHGDDHLPCVAGCQAPWNDWILNEKFHSQDIQTFGIHPSNTCQISRTVQR